MEQKLKECFVRAIEQFGLENFKKTSLFLSNERRAAAEVKAA